MVCYTESSEKSSMETVWKEAGAFKKYLAGDCMNQSPSNTVLPCEAAGFGKLIGDKMDSHMILLSCDLMNPAVSQDNMQNLQTHNCKSISVHVTAFSGSSLFQGSISEIQNVAQIFSTD